MADERHLAILKRGVEEWNRWRKQNPEITPDLSRSNLINKDLSRADFNAVNLSGADLSKAQLSHASLHGANLESATLILADLLGAILNEGNLSAASLFGAFLFGTRLKGADLRGANLMGASLMGADLSSADLEGAHLMGANFHEANLAKANLKGANLTAVSLVGAKIDGTILSDCSVYGVSACNLEGSPKLQANLVITPQGESPIMVDDLETAQFVHLLIAGKKTSLILETVQSRLILVLGNFTTDRGPVLDSIRACLKQNDFTPVVVHLMPPVNRDIENKIRLLSKYVRFVLADFTESKAVLRLLDHFESELTGVPVQTLFRTSAMEISLPESKAQSPYLHSPVAYRDAEDLRGQLQQLLSSEFS